MKVYFDFNDWWVGYYRGSNYHFACPVPTLVIRWNRKARRPVPRTVTLLVHEPEADDDHGR